MFIVFDGIDRAGKSTHLRTIKNWLYNLNIECMLVREPGGTVFAEKMRKMLLPHTLDPTIQLFLFSAARFDLTKHLAQIQKEDPNKLILCDRFIDSTYAYQGQFFDNTIINSIAKLSVNIKPDFVFLFLNRYSTDKNAMDRFATEHRAKIIERFRARAALDPKRYFIVPHGRIIKQQIIIRQRLAKLLKLKIDQDTLHAVAVDPVKKKARSDAIVEEVVKNLQKENILSGNLLTETIQEESIISGNE